jgi:hypothetical protein
MPVMMVMAGVDKHETTSIHDRAKRSVWTGSRNRFDVRSSSEFVLHFFNLSFQLSCLSRDWRPGLPIPLLRDALLNKWGEREAHGTVSFRERFDGAKDERAKYADSALTKRRAFGFFLAEDRAGRPRS